MRIAIARNFRFGTRHSHSSHLCGSVSAARSSRLVRPPGAPRCSARPFAPRALVASARVRATKVARRTPPVSLAAHSSSTTQQRTRSQSQTASPPPLRRAPAHTRRANPGTASATSGNTATASERRRKAVADAALIESLPSASTGDERECHKHDWSRRFIAVVVLLLCQLRTREVGRLDAVAVRVALGHKIARVHTAFLKEQQMFLRRPAATIEDVAQF